MRTLSATLLAEQKKPTHKPYVEAKVYDFEQGITRLPWTRLYEGSEPEALHDIAFDSEGSMHRIRRQSDHNLYWQKITNPDENSDYSAWALFGSNCGPCAIAAHPYDGRIYVFWVYDYDNSRIRYGFSDDYGATWDGPNTLATYPDVLSIAAVWWGTGDIVVCFATTATELNGITLDTSTQTATQHTYNEPSSHPLLSTYGIGATYATSPPRMCVIFAGKQSSSPYNFYALYRTEFDSDYAWLSWDYFITAPDGEDTTYEYPDIHLPVSPQAHETFQLTAMEKFAGTTAYNRPLRSQVVRGSGFSEMAYTEPKPFLDVSSTYGLRLATSSDHWWLERPNGVWRAPRAVASDWLSGWDKRIKLTIDHNDIDASLSNFPTLLHLGTSSGRNNDDISCIFDELQSDANRKKIAVTTSNGKTQCYVEIEKWDDANEQAWLWVKVPGVASGNDTELYLYYDSSHADNTDYVGDTGEAAAKNVWDSNFKLVHHMRDKTTSTLVDSTSNNNDGTKKAAGEPAAADGEINGAQDFDGSDDDVNCGNDSSLDLAHTDTLVFEAWVRNDLAIPASNTFRQILTRKTDASYTAGYLFRYAYYNSPPKYPGYWIGAGFCGGREATAPFQVPTGTFYYIAARYDGSNWALYINGAPQTTYNFNSDSGATSAPLYLGRWGDIGHYHNGIIDEVRISKGSSRTAAWIKASYEGERDDLLDWGSEETEPEDKPMFLDLTPDIISLQNVIASPSVGGRGNLVIDLNNSSGKYANPGTGDLAFLKKRSEVLLKLGYKTSEGNEASPAGIYWIDSWEYSSSPKQSVFTLHCLDAWGLASRWTARFQMRWNQDDINPKTVWHIIKHLLARNGIQLSNCPTRPQSSTLNNLKPDFIVNPGTSGDAALRRLLSMISDGLILHAYDEYQDYIVVNTKDLQADESSCYSYSVPVTVPVPHPILQGKYAQPIPLSRARAIGRTEGGDRIVQDSLDWDLLKLGIDELAQDYDPNLETTTRTQERADAILRKSETMSAAKGLIVVPTNCGQELYDVITLTDVRCGISDDKYRVLALETLFNPRQGEYQQKLILGAP